MSAGRPSRPAAGALAAVRPVRSWARGWLATLPVRIGVVLAIAALPALVLVSVADGRPFDIAVCILVGIGIAVAGIERVVTRPLREVRGVIDAWRRGETVDIPAHRSLPAELRGLSLSFKRATRTLAQREDQLRIAVERQDLAMQEIHHRVKNNLQIVASLLNLQANRIRLPEARAEFQSARDRVRALATVHRHLYAHGDVHSINMLEFLQELCGQLFQAMGETVNERLALRLDAPALEMSSDQAVPLALIVTEAVTNAIKYAYPAGRRGSIAVTLRQMGDSVLLEISDDGVGVAAGRAETAEGTRDGLGIQLINGFARQLGGELEVEQGAGTRYRVRMRLRRDRVPAPALREPNAPALRE